MSLRNLISYAAAGSLAFDASKVQFAGGHALLKLASLAALTFSQAFTSSTGFTFDATTTEFVGGVLRQKDLRPANARVFASFATATAASWGNGSTATVANGGAAISGGYLQVNATGKYLALSALNNTDLAQTGCVRLTVKPGYSGTPGALQLFYASSISAAATNNYIAIYHVASNIHADIRNSGNGSIVAISGAWSPVAGTDYEIELNFDVTTGATRLFVNGVQVGATSAGTGTRTTATTVTNIGADFNGTSNTNPNFAARDLVVFSSVQHAANYSAPSAIPSESVYSADTITFPTQTYSGAGSIQSFDAASLTDANAPRYVLNSTYWDGAAWAASDSSFGQATPAATILAHFGTFPTSNTLAVKLITQTSNTAQQSISAAAFTYTGQTYSTDNPTIVNAITSLDGLSTFADVEASSGSDAVKFAIVVGGLDQYWNGAAWAASSSFAQSNTAAELASHIAALDVSAGASVAVKAYLHSSDGTTSPTLTSAYFDYNFYVAPPAAPNRCIAFAFLHEMIAHVVGEDATMTVILRKAFSHSGRIVVPYERTFTVTIDGYVETTPAFLVTSDDNAVDGIVETQSISLSPYDVVLEYRDAKQKRKRVRASGVQIPNSVSVNLASIVSFV